MTKTMMRGIFYVIAIIYGLALSACGDSGNDSASNGAPLARADDSAALTALPSAEELRALQGEIDNFDAGNRPAGSEAELAFIEHLNIRLESLGVSTQKHPFSFDRWNPPAQFSLEILEGPDAGSFDLAAYIPFSGTGDEKGIEAPLVYASIDPVTGLIEGEDPRGKIVVVDVPPAPLPLAVFRSIAYYEHDPDNDTNPNDIYRRTWLAQAGMWVILDALSSAGAAGLVAVLDLPEEAARGAYFPYDGNIRNVPGVYVDREVGSLIKNAATGVQARLVMNATVDSNSTSYNLSGIIPGAPGPDAENLIVLHSHTDGPNSIEDNGTIAVVELARYFKGVPQADRPKSILILLTSGHFSGWAGALAWVEENQALKSKVATIISLEHLGAREYVELADGSYGLTGRNEMGGIFVGPNEPLVSEGIELLKREDIKRHFVLRPFYPSRSEPGEIGWPGEATEFETAGFPTLQYITGPQYLLNWGVDTTNTFTDYALMHRLMRGFAQMVHNLMPVDADELRDDDPGTLGSPLE